MNYPFLSLKNSSIQKLIQDKQSVSIEFHNGIKLNGTILSFDNGILQFNHRFLQAIYLHRIHAIRTLLNPLILISMKPISCQK